ncbi:carbohydrate ABC transporter permease [Aureimonas sp. N4]|uniref:carbohydrate ABC transporter permease n=1 Tax=Aureimonas sp. N4 TaxID=1638165 RepID=UPI0007844019|nr:carbohydrate ABC transporter permease [Aureimonas sp. N4]
MKKLTPQAALGYFVLALFVFISLLPLWMALKLALTNPADVYTSAGSLLPGRFTFGNFLRVMGLPSDIELAAFRASPIDFTLALRNSLIYTALTVSGQIFFSAMAGYALARMKFPGRDALFFAFLAATMIPSMVLFIPNFILVKQLGLLNTFAGLAAPTILMTPFAVFFLRQFFLSAPKELDEAARLEGASQFQIFWRIALPIQKGPIATLAILLSVNSWNEFFWPFLVGRDPSVRVMAVALSDFMSQTGQGNPDWSGLMAAIALSILPIIALLVVFGRQIVESLQTSGMK